MLYHIDTDTTRPTSGSSSSIMSVSLVSTDKDIRTQSTDQISKRWITHTHTHPAVGFFSPKPIPVPFSTERINDVEAVRSVVVTSPCG